LKKIKDKSNKKGGRLKAGGRRRKVKIINPKKILSCKAKIVLY